MTIGDFEILSESELQTLEQSSGDDCDMASVKCVVRELRRLRADVERLTKERDSAQEQERIMVDCVVGAPHNQAVLGTAEHAIANWLETELSDDCSEAIETIRSGAWRSA